MIMFIAGPVDWEGGPVDWEGGPVDWRAEEKWMGDIGYYYYYYQCSNLGGDLNRETSLDAVR